MGTSKIAPRGRRSETPHLVLGGILCVLPVVIALGERKVGPAATFGSLSLIPVLLSAWFLSSPWVLLVGGLALAGIWFDSAGHAITVDTALAQSGTLVIIVGLTFVAKISLRRQRQAEERASRLEAENEQQRRMRVAKTRFLLGVSHELRTPLTVIRGYLAMLDDRDIPDAILPRAIHVANSQAARLEELIKQLIDGFDPAASVDAALLPLEAEEATSQPDPSAGVMLPSTPDRNISTRPSLH